MASVYLQKGNTFTPQSDKDLVIQKKLPGNTFLVNQDAFGNLVLEQIADMAIPDEIYGNEPDKVSRVINTYLSRPKNTGVILEGEKGAGKTLFTKLVSCGLRQQGIPTIIINQPFSSQQLGPFLESIDMECCVILDEFEKVFDDSRKQNQLLTILDGVFTSKKLFVITVNQTFGLSHFFKNRPGRFFYNFSYKSLDRVFIEQFCKKNLKNQDRLNQLINYCSIFSSLNFDMLSAIVEELNRYDDGKEPIVNILKFLNASPMEEHSKYKIEKIEFKGDFIAQDHSKYLNGSSFMNPFQEESWCWLHSKKITNKNEDIDISDYDDGEKYFLRFQPQHLIKVEKGHIYFENSEGTLIAVKEDKQQQMTIDMMRLSL